VSENTPKITTERYIIMNEDIWLALSGIAKIIDRAY
jgi:hypothetical protein